jgi:hypothetical protein
MCHTVPVYDLRDSAGVIIVLSHPPRPLVSTLLRVLNGSPLAWISRRTRTRAGQKDVGPGEAGSDLAGDKGIKIGEGTFANVYKGELSGLARAEVTGAEKATGRQGAYEMMPLHSCQWPSRRSRLAR